MYTVHCTVHVHCTVDPSYSKEWAQEEDERTQRAARPGGPSMERTTIYIVSIVVLTITLTVEV